MSLAVSPASRRRCSWPRLAAVALALSMVLPWYQKSVLRSRARSSRATCRRSASSRSSRPRSCSSRSPSCSSSGRARSAKAFHLPGGDGVAITIAGGWAVLLLVWRHVRQARRPGRRRRPRHPVGALRRADLRGRADRRGRARASGASPRAAEPGRRRHRLGRSAARASASAGPSAGRATRPRSPRCCAIGRRGRASRASRRRGCPIARRSATTRLPDDPRSARRGCPTTRGDERTDDRAALDDPSRAKTHARLPEDPLRGAHPPPAAPGTTPAAVGGRLARLPARRGASAASDRPPWPTGRPRPADDRGVNLSAASIYQIDERGLELRRSYMRMTAAEFELLSGMQAWAERNAEAIGKALAEHTFSAGPAGGFLREYANAKGIAGRRAQEGLGLRPGGPLQGHLRARPASPAASASSTSRGCSASARCTARSTCR